VFGSGDDINMKVTADADQAVQSFAKLGEAIHKTGLEATEANSKLELLKKGYEALKVSIEGLNRVGEWAVQGRQINEVAAGFDRLSKQAGILSNTLLTQLREASHETITDFDLMKQANHELAQGLKPDQIEIGDRFVRRLTQLSE
jgi:hypothetical protein